MATISRADFDFLMQPVSMGLKIMGSGTVILDSGLHLTLDSTLFMVYARAHEQNVDY